MFSLIKYVGVINFVLLGVLIFTGSCQTTASQKIAAKDHKCEGERAQDACCQAKGISVFTSDRQDAKALIVNALVKGCVARLEDYRKWGIINNCRLELKKGEKENIKTFSDMDKCMTKFGI